MFGPWRKGTRSLACQSAACLGEHQIKLAALGGKTGIDQLLPLRSFRDRVQQALEQAHIAVDPVAYHPLVLIAVDEKIEHLLAASLIQPMRVDMLLAGGIAAL